MASFSNDALVGLTVDHDLPAAGTDRVRTGADGQAFGLGLGAVEVLAVFLDPNGETPFFEQMDGIINVAAQVEDQVFADDAHEVGADHADVIVDIVVTAVGVDGGQALCNGTGTLESSLVAEFNGDGGIDFLNPTHSFESGTAVTHATADQQDINAFFDDFRLGESNTLGSFFE